MRKLAIMAMVGLLLPAGTSSAQFLFGPVGGTLISGGGVRFGYQSKRFFFGGSIGQTSVYRYGLVGPPLYGAYSFGPPIWFGPPDPFVFGPGPFFLPPPPPVIIVQQPIIVPFPVIAPVQAVEPVEAPKVPDLERFIVIRPDRPKNPAEAPALGRVEKQPLPVDFGVPAAELPLAEGPAAQPDAEADRRIALGRSAFAQGEYGRAIEHFKRAIAVAPDNPAAWFYSGQAQFAIGKFDEAVASIVQGMKLKPDWPDSRFEPRAMYRFRVDEFNAQIDGLRTALAENPNDPRLLFLLGVELWFDGRREEARTTFDRAMRFARDKAPIEAFVQR